jgi:DNA-binding transcriptional regulator/RsmH inhibitor MraZ
MAVDGRGRCSVPQRVHDGLDWFSFGAELLLDLRPGGRINVLAGARMMSIMKRLDALTAGAADEAAEDDLLLLVDRFVRVVIDGESSRLKLPGHVRAHLDVLNGGVALAVRVRDKMEIWSKGYRESRLADAERAFGELP